MSSRSCQSCTHRASAWLHKASRQGSRPLCHQPPPPAPSRMGTIGSGAFGWRLFISREGQPCRKPAPRSKNNLKGCRRHQGRMVLQGVAELSGNASKRNGRGEQRSGAIPQHRKRTLAIGEESQLFTRKEKSKQNEEKFEQKKML